MTASPECGKMWNRKKVPVFPPYLLIRGRAENIPLLGQAVGLVIATPPYRGATRVPQKECCTKDAGQYDALLCRFLEEAARIIKPGAYILLHTRWPAIKRIAGLQPIEFHVFRRPFRRGRYAIEWVRKERIAACFTHVKGIPWLALPVWLYRLLIRRYSKPGHIVAHVFSGSGNSAIAALELSRVPVLLDLHYHRAVKRRVNNWIKHEKTIQAFTGKR